MKRRLANLPLHGGKAPPWLFRRMTQLAGAVTMAIVDEFGPAEMLRRLSDPWWFQAFGCVLGFDWHSSGVTTVTCGALKEAFQRFGADLGIFVAGGKGGTSRHARGDRRRRRSLLDHGGRSAGLRLADERQGRFGRRAGRLPALPPRVLVHARRAVVRRPAGHERGEAKLARRYHWLGERVGDFVCEPHDAISDLSDRRQSAPRPTDAAQHGGGRGGQNRARRRPWSAKTRTGSSGNRAANRRADPVRPEESSSAVGGRQLAPAATILSGTRTGNRPGSFETLLGTQGVGPATVLSLSLLAELIFDAPGVTSRSGRTHWPKRRLRGTAALGRLCLRPRRQRRHALSRRPRHLRPQHRRSDRRRPQGTHRPERQDERPPPPGGLSAVSTAPAEPFPPPNR